MLVEGRGDVVPSCETILISASDFTWLSAEADKRNQYRSYSSRADTWGRGLVTNPTLVGMLGEHAVCVYLNKRIGSRLIVDTDIRAEGDGGTDLEIDNIGIQVKTRQPTSKSNLFRRVDSKKRIRPLRSDYHVFCRRVHDREIQILGWVSSSEITRVAKHVRSHVGDWWNLNVPDSALQCMGRLVEEIKLQRSP